MCREQEGGKGGIQVMESKSGGAGACCIVTCGTRSQRSPLSLWSCHLPLPASAPLLTGVIKLPLTLPPNWCGLSRKNRLQPPPLTGVASQEQCRRLAVEGRRPAVAGRRLAASLACHCMQHCPEAPPPPSPHRCGLAVPVAVAPPPLTGMASQYQCRKPAAMSLHAALSRIPTCSLYLS